jgi:hypothetical protein
LREGSFLRGISGSSEAEIQSVQYFIFYNPEEHKKTELEDFHAKAVMTISPDSGQYTPIIEDVNFELPDCGSEKRG